MYQPGRRKFLHASALLLTSAVLDTSFVLKPKKPMLAFSTLGCPDWTFEQIVDFAVQQQYKGIELRGIQRQLDLTQCPVFNSKQKRKEAKALMKDRELRFVDLGSSCTLHFAEGVERRKNIAEGKKFIELANDINCPYIRVFPNIFPKEMSKEAAMELISKGLLELGEFAAGSGVKVLLESHGDLVKINDLELVMQAAAHYNTGLLWDITNMWAVTKESPYQAFQRLKQYIRHVHVKDGILVDGKIQYRLTGQGEVPVKEAVQALMNGGYKGYYSFEWEKLWHPEIEEPGIALRDYVKVMHEYFD